MDLYFFEVSLVEGTDCNMLVETNVCLICMSRLYIKL